MADPVHYDRCHGGLVEGADLPGGRGGICAQSDPVRRIPSNDFFRCGALGAPFFCVPSGEHSFEELFFSEIRSEDSVSLHEAGLRQGPGGGSGML